MGPNTTLQFAGIELDSVRQEARLPLDKLAVSRKSSKEELNLSKIAQLDFNPIARQRSK